MIFDKWQDPSGGSSVAADVASDKLETNRVASAYPRPHHFDGGEFGAAADAEGFTATVKATEDIGTVKHSGVVHAIHLKATGAIKGDESPVKIKIELIRGEAAVGHVEHTVSTHVDAKAPVQIGIPFDVHAEDVLHYAEGPDGAVVVEFGA